MKTLSTLLLFASVTAYILMFCHASDSKEHSDEDTQYEPPEESHGDEPQEESHGDEPQGAIAFSLKLNSSAPPGIVKFDNNLTEEGVSYNKTTGKIRILKGGIYSIHWNHVSLSRFAKTELMVNNSSVASIVSDVFPTRGFQTDDASTSGTFILQNSSELCIFANETIQPESFLTGYLIKEMNNSAFYATTDGIVISLESSPRYDNILLNTSSDFRVDQFVASRDGFYVFSIMSASFDGIFNTDFDINNNKVGFIAAGELIFAFTPIGIGQEPLRTLSSGAKTCVVRLNETDVVNLPSREGAELFEIRDDIPWIFTGFRYLDADVTLPAVFVQSGQTELSQVPMNLLVFGIVQLDNANNFSPNTGLFTATTEGLHAISVTVQSTFRSRYEVLVSSNTVSSGLNEGPSDVILWTNGSGRVLILPLEVGDTVQVNVIEGDLFVGFISVDLSIWVLPSNV